MRHRKEVSRMGQRRDRRSASPSGRSCWRCCPPCSTRRSWPPRCRRSQPSWAGWRTSRGWSPPMSWRRRLPRRCGARSATGTGESACSRSRWRLFLVASALCGVAQSLWMLVVARAIQGAAAGGLMSLAQAAVGDLVSPRERGRYQGYIMATFAVAAAAGSADRRPAGRSRELAVGVLRQPAGWGAGARRRCTCGSRLLGAAAAASGGSTLPARRCWRWTAER